MRRTEKMFALPKPFPVDAYMSGNPQAPAKILVVDDDDHVREALVDELSGTYWVRAASSGNDALVLLASEQYDVVISDLRMPGADGIEVLEFARRHQRDSIRVLLTGYLDERARTALLQPDAPFKIGKPWHDEVEVTVRRGLEQRELVRRQSASIEDALGLATFDEQLAATATQAELADVVVRRCLDVKGVICCGVTSRTSGPELLVTGSDVPRNGQGWFVELPLDDDGAVRLKARGLGEGARQLVAHMAQRAQRRNGVMEARVIPTRTQRMAGTRVDQLLRQATLGALTSALLHDLASTMQALTSALSEVQCLAAGQSELTAASNDAIAAGNEAVQLFVHMRKFICAGQVDARRVSLRAVLDRAHKLVGGYVKERGRLVIGEIPYVEIAVSESLFLQVVSNLLRNAANASPRGGQIDVIAHVDEDTVTLSVIDDGPGVAPEIAGAMFEPFATTTQSGTGLGLAISAFVVQSLGGKISYRRHATRGACFTVTLPTADAATQADDADDGIADTSVA